MEHRPIFEEAARIMTHILNISGSGVAYSNTWSNEFRCKEIDEAFETEKDGHDEYFWRKVFALSNEEKLILGFRYFDENKDKMLIPIWIWNLLPDDMFIEDGGKTVKELDNDTRAGLVFWKA